MSETKKVKKMSKTEKLKKVVNTAEDFCDAFVKAKYQNVAFAILLKRFLRRMDDEDIREEG